MHCSQCMLCRMFASITKQSLFRLRTDIPCMAIQSATTVGTRAPQRLHAYCKPYMHDGPASDAALGRAGAQVAAMSACCGHHWRGHCASCPCRCPPNSISAGGVNGRCVACSSPLVPNPDQSACVGEWLGPFECVYTFGWRGGGQSFTGLVPIRS
jgi:hypothetical protein